MTGVSDLLRLQRVQGLETQNRPRDKRDRKVEVTPHPPSKKLKLEGFRVQGLELSLQGSGLGFRVQGSGFRVWGLGFRVQGLWFGV